MPLANLYHAPDATAQDRAALVAAWHAMRGVMNGLLVTGLVILPLALLGLASAMRVVPALGRRVGAFSMVLGAIGLGAALLLLVDPLSTVAVVGILVLTLFHLVAGWRLTRMARSETSGSRVDRRTEARRPAVAGVSPRARP